MRESLRVMLVAGLLLAVAAPARAQTAPPPPPAAQAADESEPRMNLALGYQYLRDTSWEEQLFYGWVAALTLRMTRNLAAVGEFSGSHGEFRNTGFTIQRYALLGGMRLTAGEGEIRPFFQGLVGVGRQGGDVGRADGIIVQPGGGADFLLTDRWTIRGQGDYRFLREDGNNWSQYRLSGSIVIQLGKRR